MYDNKVEFLGYYGSDETHALSAWTSTSREIDEEKRSRIPQLLSMLAENGHETPFEKSMFHFLVTTDIATHIHLLKHRIAVSINGESARYKELKEDKFYLPADWDIKISDTSFDSESSDLYYLFSEFNENTWESILQWYTELGNRFYHNCLRDLTPILGRKRAKESARFFKTYNSQITADISFNWRSFVHFYKLRADEHAQLEIQEIAKQMLQIIKDIPGNPFQHSITAFKL